MNYSNFAVKVDTVLASDTWRRMEQALAKFPRYESQTVFSILRQDPNATRVASKTVWASLGRRPVEGAPAIRIRGGAVYEHRFTEGAPIPEVLPEPVLADGLPEVDRALVRLMERHGYSVHFEPLTDGNNGFVDYTARYVGISEDLSGAMLTRTLLHEATHAFHHRDAIYGRGAKEVEAEATAALTCAALGIDTSAYSPSYVARWSAAQGVIHRHFSIREHCKDFTRQHLRRLGA
jgi:hypothetical protein